MPSGLGRRGELCLSPQLAPAGPWYERQSIMPSDGFGWADDSTGPIDTTPANLPQPPEALIDAAARAVPAILANVDPSRNHGEISLVASLLTGFLVKQGHTLHAACWAVHRLAVEGKLLAKPAYDGIPTVMKTTGSRGIPGLFSGTPQRTEFVGGGYSMRSIPEGRPAHFGAFRVIPTDALWAWWREPSAGQVSKGQAYRGDVEVLRLRLQSLYGALYALPTVGPAAELANIMQQQSNLQSEIARIEQQIVAAAQPGEVPAGDTDAEILGADGQPAVPAADADNGANNGPETRKKKRSTERGEGRAKLIAALTKYHKYADGGCLNPEPIGNNDLARKAEVSDSTASAFFTKEFGGHTKYRALCGDAKRLVGSLKLLNQEYSPHDLYGRKPPGEDDRDDER